MATTYSKLNDGSWGIRTTEHIAAGGTIRVTKKSGESKVETVGRIVWTGNGVTLATIAHSEPSRGPSRPRAERTYRRRYGWDGVRGSASYYSSGMYDEES